MAGALLVLFLWLEAVATLQALHLAIHSDANQPNHHCAVKTLAPERLNCRRVKPSLWCRSCTVWMFHKSEFQFPARLLNSFHLVVLLPASTSDSFCPRG